MKMRCIAIDDEPLALLKITEYISRVSFLELMGQFGKPIDALEYLHHNKVDLIFLDIQMDLLTGIQLLEILHEKPFIILTTAYGQYALKGYELDVSDYLLKPFNFERFLKAADKVYNHFHERRAVVGNQPPWLAVPGKYLFVKNGNHTEKIDPSDILYVEGMREYLGIHLPGRKILTLLSFQKLEEKLPPGQFIRIHKSYMVPVSKIQSVGPHHVKINQVELPIGEHYRGPLLKLICQ